jgi:uncharacterized protein (TIGR03435 family)
MSFNSDKRFGFTALIITAHLGAQEPSPPVGPRFEVVSIRSVPVNAPPVMRDQDFTPILPGGQYVDSRTSLSWMIGFAYDMKFLDLQLAGLPNWAKTQIFSVSARPSPDFAVLPPNENTQQVRLMMRAMLADRFHLRLHTEMRNEPVYNLEVARGGVKVREVDAPIPPAKQGLVNTAWSDSDIRMIGNKSTMSGLATALTIMLQTLVVDKTNLKGYYDIDVKWRDPEALARQPAAPGFSTEGIGFLISSLQSEFGLRLTKATGPTECWVIDHVEPPTDN